MTIVTQMKADRIVARATNNKGDFALLTNVLGEFDLARTQKVNIGKPEDNILWAIVKIHINRATEEIESLRAVNAPVHRIDRAMQDISVLETYLPEMLDEEDLRKTAAASKLLGWTMGDMMKHLKTQFEGRYDGKLASSIAKEILG